MNILLLTNIYPNNDPDYKGTSVCHSFTKEWISLGYKVRVIHFDSLFPRPYYWLAHLFVNRLQAKTGDVVYLKTPRKPKTYNVDEVPVCFVPLKKFLPHKAPSNHIVEKAFRHVIKELENEQFVPDIVTAHFPMPQLQFLPLFKMKYPNARTCMVLHSESDVLSYYYPHSFIQLMRSVDVWGFRSKAFLLDFEKHINNYASKFICFSGIPEKYISNNNKVCPKDVKRFVFVGSLYKLKNVDVAIKAISKAMGNRDYQFDIVGDGAESESLKRLSVSLGVDKKIIFHGRQSRDDAQKVLENADCFVMVSSHEAFGLVYVEAMAKGIIVIGTKGQGIDGVVQNGINGFLCEANNVDALADIIQHIVTMSREERQKISDLSVETARKLTDKSVAEHYINSICIN